MQASSENSGRSSSLAGEEKEIDENRKVFFSGVSKDTSVREMTKYANDKFGPVKKVQFQRKRYPGEVGLAETNQHRGSGFIIFHNAEHAWNFVEYQEHKLRPKDDFFQARYYIKHDEYWKVKATQISENRKAFIRGLPYKYNRGKYHFPSRRL